MSDPNKPDRSDPTQAGYPPNTDPAYAGQYWGPQGSGYYGAPTGTTPTGAPMTGPMAGPTQQLPPYWQTAGYAPGQPPPPPPQPPKSNRWLWIAATAAVLLVAGLVLALVIVSSSSRQSTVVAPLPTTTAPSVPRATTTAPRVPTPTNRPVPTPTTRPVPPPVIPGIPGETTVPSTGTESVVYNVSGEGRAINITYVDTGGVMQTEFNVALPWSKEVSLGAPAKNSASVAVVNVGRDVTCSVSVNGAQVRQRTGRGLTICTGVA